MIVIDHAASRPLIEAAMERYPILNASGFTTFRSDRTREEAGRIFTRERASMLTPLYVSQFIRAHAYLQMLPRMKRVNLDSISSYGLKHIAERWWEWWLERNTPGHTHGYVANGMLIAAAHALEFEISAPPEHINAHFNIKRKVPMPPQYIEHRGETLDFSPFMPHAIADELETTA